MGRPWASLQGRLESGLGQCNACLEMELEDLLRIQEEAHQVVINQLKTEIQRLSRL